VLPVADGRSRICDTSGRDGELQPLKENKTMSPEKLDAVTTELKRFAQSLNLSDAQKTQLRNFLTEKHGKIQEFRQQNPNISRQDLIQKITSLRGSLREQVVKFLTPEQLGKWDAEVTKAREFLGHSIMP
jgi:hypothetical protein